MLFGYAQVSTADQNPDHQIDTLLRAGVDRDNIHVDAASGAKASRPKLNLVLQLLREGDTLKVTRLDRLSRSVLHLVTLGANLRERGIGLHVIERSASTFGRDSRSSSRPHASGPSRPAAVAAKSSSNRPHPEATTRSA